MLAINNDLQILIGRHNLITDLKSVGDVVKTLPALHQIELQGNPCSRAGEDDNAGVYVLHLLLAKNESLKNAVQPNDKNVGTVEGKVDNDNTTTLSNAAILCRIDDRNIIKEDYGRLESLLAETQGEILLQQMEQNYKSKNKELEDLKVEIAKKQKKELQMIEVAIEQCKARSRVDLEESSLFVKERLHHLKIMEREIVADDIYKIRTDVSNGEWKKQEPPL